MMDQDLMGVASRVCWFKAPAEVLADSIFFLGHVMTYGTIEDILTVKRHYTDQEFVDALENAPSGVFDPRSWSYWHVVYGKLPVPPLPERGIPGL